MWTIGALSFLVPWALAGLVALPVIWWLLRLKPPMPRRVVFPPIVLLRRLISQRESPVRIPPWLLLLRLTLAALIVVGQAEPLLNAETRLFGQGPVYLIVDVVWAAASAWSARRSTLRDLLDHAERSARPVVLVTTAPAPEGAALPAPQVLGGAEARRLFEGLQPKPWPTDRTAVVDNLLASDAVRDQRPGDVVWLSNGLAETAVEGADNEFTTLVRRLQRLGAVTVIADPPARLPVVLMPPDVEGAALK
ncbi:MAG: BatA domain-containing protein, partial [Rhodospirillaceae bacterium]